MNNLRYYIYVAILVLNISVGATISVPSIQIYFGIMSAYLFIQILEKILEDLKK